MKTPNTPHLPELVEALKERAKELSCLYQVEEITRDGLASLEDVFTRVLRALPSGWRYSEHCQARITHGERLFQTPGFRPPMAVMAARLVVTDNEVGTLEVSYPLPLPELDNGPFLAEERRLIEAVADRLSHTIFHRTMGPLLKEFRDLKRQNDDDKAGEEWRVVLGILRLSDPNLYQRVSRRMLNHLFYVGARDANELLERMSCELSLDVPHVAADDCNTPLKKLPVSLDDLRAAQAFEIAADVLGKDTVLAFIQKWIRENKFSFLIDVLENHTSTLQDIANALARFTHDGTDERELSISTLNAVHVSLIRRFFSRNLELINIARTYVTIDDFYAITRRLVAPENSSGELGGKAAGLFTAVQILKAERARLPELGEVLAPKTWYISSDGIIDFIHYNHLEELLEQKYQDIDRIRMEYPNIIQLFKNSSFSPEMVRKLSQALDEFGERPLIVRSSTLLEDSFDAAFSGKYKSLFLANQGPKADRLEGLLDAVAEVYASLFSPDPIEYRTERGLLDYQEEMGILIQEVIGTRVGKYVFPACAGVAFSNNEFRWSPRIRREDGLIRLVPGLGTRAVDRVGDDFPVLIAPDKPQLRVNPQPAEARRYAPKWMDVINLDSNAFETVPVERLLAELGHRFPRARQLFSRFEDGLLTRPNALCEFDDGEYVTTFEGLLSESGVIAQIRSILHVLQRHYGRAMDIEFAVDDAHFYLLQCRPQSFERSNTRVVLPYGVDDEEILFTANKYVTDGLITGITHIVYVSPEGYDALESRADLLDVGKAVSLLNTVLPKRRFVLMGPGRWGSRGDIKLGVNVNYSDINNTAALIEMACKKGNYVPDLSFGTHFFQDLVEAAIRYLPLYPDEADTVFKAHLFNESPNLLRQILPAFAHLDSVVRVIEVGQLRPDRMLNLVMSGDENRAMAYFAPRGGGTRRTGQSLRQSRGADSERRRRPARRPLDLAHAHGRTLRGDARWAAFRAARLVSHRQHGQRLGRGGQRHRPDRPAR